MSEFIRKEEVATRLQFVEMVKGLWPFARPYPWLLTAAVLSLLVTIVSSRLLPHTIGYAVDRGILPKDADALVTAAWMFLGLEILHAGSQFLYAFLFQRFGNRVLADLREALIRHVQKLPLDYFHRNPVGRIVTRLTNDPANLNEVFSEGLINILANLLILLSIVVAMLLISWKLTLVTLGLMPLFIWIALRITERIRLIMRDSKKQLATMNAFASERLQGVKVLQALNVTGPTNDSFVSHSEEYKGLLLRSIRSFALMQPVMNLSTAVLIASALAAGGYMTLNESLRLGSLVAFILHAQDFIPPLREILEKFQQFQNSLTSAERVFPMFEEKPEAANEPDAPGLELEGRLEVRNLWFRYQEDHPWIFRDLNLVIEKGRKVALVGRTGAGKSTLIALLQRFYDAPPGTILLDGRPLEEIPRARLRRWMGVVQQDPVLFRGTIADNLNLGDETLTRSRMEEALREIGAWDFLARGGRGLDSWVEERGANLSLGERQLLAFARILVFDPKFLILDEATANIDSETEALIQRAVERVTQDRTSLIIAHRLSTLRHCDTFFEIREGRAHVPSAGV